MLASYLQDSTGLSGAMAAQLTSGAVVAISENADSNGTLQPMLQVVDVQMIKTPCAERFRMVLSDGVYTMHAMLLTAENTRVRDGSIQKGSIIHLQEFTCSTVQNLNCRIIVVMRLDVLQSECDIIGNPKPYVMRNQPDEQVTNLSPNPCISLSREVSNMSRNFVRKTIAQIKDENLGRSDKPDFVTVRAVLSHVRTDKFCYPACTLELNGKRCYKKVRRNGDGTWYCNRCNQRTENCEYRYVLSCRIKDHTGTTYAVALQEAGEAIFGHTAQELFMIRNVEQDDVRFTGIIQAVLWCEYLFKLRINEETFNGQQHVRCIVIGVEKLEETNHLLNDVSRPTLEAKQSLLTSSNADGCATGFVQSEWKPTPLSASSEIPSYVISMVASWVGRQGGVPNCTSYATSLGTGLRTVLSEAH